MDRSFTVVSVQSRTYRIGKNETGGRFISKNPASAARKAVNGICRRMNLTSCSMTIRVMETTRGSNNKVYGYNVKRVKSPMMVERDGVFIEYKYNTISKALKK